MPPKSKGPVKCYNTEWLSGKEVSCNSCLLPEIPWLAIGQGILTNFNMWLTPETEYTVLWLIVQSCLTLCDPMDCSPQGSSVHEDSPGKNTGGLPCPPPGDILDLGIEPRPPALQADSSPSWPLRKPWICVLSSYLKDACVLKVLEYLTFSNYQVCFTILQYNGFQKKVKIVKLLELTL